MMNRPAGTVERAFELARHLKDVEEIRGQLRAEGYFNVDAHLMGKQIRSELAEIIRQAADPPHPGISS